MDDISRLVIRVDSDGVETADKRLAHVTDTAEKTERATDKLVATVKHLVFAYLSVEGALKALEKTFDVTKEFQMLEAQIVTATGAVEGAHDALKALDDMESKSVFSLKELTDAFTGLINKGLDPSQKALAAYGNIAVAMNISLDTVTGSIIQASSGMYRSLMTMGIKVKETADGLVLTYRGTSTKIRKDSADIEQYIQNLGNTQFANAMSNRMKGLEGDVIRLRETWQDLFLAIGEAGGTKLMAEGFLLATRAVRELTDLIASGQLMGYIDAMKYKFSALLDGATNAFINITAVIQMSYEYWTKDGKGAIDFLIGAFKQMPENVRAVVQAIGAAFGYLTTVVDTIWTGIGKATNTAFNVMVANSMWAAQAINKSFSDPKNAGTYLKEAAAAIGQNLLTMGNAAITAYAETKAGISAANEALEQEIVSIMNERDARLGSFKAQIDAADRLREAHDKLNKSKEDSKTDPLAGFKPAQGDTHINSPADIAAFEALKKELQLEEVSIAESYRRRSELIRNNTKGDKELELSLMKELEERVTVEYETAFQDRSARVLKIQDDLRVAIAAGRISEVESLQLQLQMEEQHSKESYEKRREQILADTQLTEEQRLKKLTTLESKYSQSQRDQEIARQKATLSITADFFGNLSTIASAFGKKGAKIAKAAAIIQTTIKTYESATSAYASLAGIPYIGPALGAVAAGAAIAAGMANIAAIKAQDYSGGYAHGGMIPGGSYGIVGETGQPELVQGPAVVTSASRTSELGLNSGSGSRVTLIINNTTSAEVVKQSETVTDTGTIIQLAVRESIKAVANDIDSGGGPVTSAAQRRWNVRRGAA